MKDRDKRARRRTAGKVTRPRSSTFIPSAAKPGARAWIRTRRRSTVTEWNSELSTTMAKYPS